MSFARPLDEQRSGTGRSQQMAEHTAEALGSAYVRYLMQRTGKTAENVRDAYFSQTGNTPEGGWGRFRKWAGERVFLMDQLGRDPFLEDAR